MVLIFDTAIDIWHRSPVQAQDGGVTVPLGFETDIRRVHQLETQNRKDQQTIVLLIQTYERMLELLHSDETPDIYSAIQNNLGNAYCDLPTGDRAANLGQAIQCYQEALHFLTPETDPLEYAGTQNNLGIAYRNLITKDWISNLTQAIGCYQQALRFLTPKTSPLAYAQTQNNLGNAYCDLPTGDRAANLGQAIQCYQEALHFLTPETDPLMYAATQNNLGIAYHNLLTGDKASNLMQAIQCYREALRFYTPEDCPLAYASVQYNMGNAYCELQTGDKASNLMQAIQRYREALRFYTPQIDPLMYAATQNNLGIAYYNLPGDRAANLTQAIRSYQEALRFSRSGEFNQNLGGAAVGALMGSTILPGISSIMGGVLGSIVGGFFAPTLKSAHEKNIPMSQNVLYYQAQHNKEVAERKLSDIQTSIVPLFALARTTLEEGEKAIINKTYFILAGISQSKTNGDKIEQFDLPLSSIDEPLSLDVVLHISEKIKLMTERFKLLLYDPLNHDPQFVDFTFQVMTPGHCNLEIHFYHERRWLTAIQVEFEAIENSQHTADGSEV